jgi:hypothetical protein
MRYTTLLLLMFVIIISSCRKTRVTDNRVTTLSATYLTGTGIDTTHNSNGNINYKMKASNTTCFSYTMSSDIPGAYDAATGSSLYFMVDSGATTFSYTDAELEKRHTYYNTYDGWGGGGTWGINKGTINGYKDGNLWQVTINVPLPVDDNVTNTNYIKTTSTFRIGAVL